MEAEKEVGLVRRLNRLSSYSLWGIPVGLILITIYLGFTSEVNQSELVPHEIFLVNVLLVKDKDKSAVMLKDRDGKEYRMGRSLWSDVYDSRDLLTRLRYERKCTIWLNKNGEEDFVFGLRSDYVYLPPSRGVEIYNHLLCLLPISGGVFIIIPLFYLGRERYLSRRKKE